MEFYFVLIRLVFCQNADLHAIVFVAFNCMTQKIHFSIREPTVGHNEIKLRAENFPFLVESTTVGTALE